MKEIRFGNIPLIGRTATSEFQDNPASALVHDVTALDSFKPSVSQARINSKTDYALQQLLKQGSVFTEDAAFILGVPPAVLKYAMCRIPSPIEFSYYNPPNSKRVKHQARMKLIGYKALQDCLAKGGLPGARMNDRAAYELRCMKMAEVLRGLKGKVKETGHRAELEYVADTLPRFDQLEDGHTHLEREGTIMLTDELIIEED